MRIKIDMTKYSYPEGHKRDYVRDEIWYFTKVSNGWQCKKFVPMFDGGEEDTNQDQIFATLDDAYNALVKDKENI